MSAPRSPSRGTAVVAGAPDDDISTRERLTNPTQGSVTAWAEFVAADDAYTTDQSVPLTVPAPGVLANDANPSGGQLIAQLASGPAHGTLALNVDGSFTYVPAADFSGADAFSYHAQVGTHVVEPGDGHDHRPPAPDRRPGQLQHRAGHAADRDRAAGVLANDTSGSGGPLTARLAGGPAHGTRHASTRTARSPTPRRPATAARTRSPTRPTTAGSTRSRRP